MARIDNHCPNCGQSNGAKGDFCPRCGWKYSDPVETPVTDQPEQEEHDTAPAAADQPKGGNPMNTVLRILGGVLLLVLIVIAIIFLFGLRGCTKTPDTSNVSSTTSSAITPTITVTPTAAAMVNTVIVNGEKIETYVSTPIAADGKYTLKDPDQKDVSMDFSKAIGFTPDKNLLVSGLKTETLGLDLSSLTGNWDAYLNNSNKPYAGFTDGTNDYNQYYNHQSGPQVPAYSWMIHTGLYVEMPGIGRVEGGPGRAVLVLILNRTDRVYRFPTNSVTVIAGFQGWGRIWNGDEKPVIETEKRITNHFLTRLGLGIPEKGFIGQTDQGAENATTVTVVTVQYIQWGKNADGTPRYQFQLLRSETVNAIKK